MHWVHFYPYISRDGCIAHVLMKNCPESGPWPLRKELFVKNCGTFLDVNGEGLPLYSLCTRPLRSLAPPLAFETRVRDALITYAVL